MELEELELFNCEQRNSACLDFFGHIVSFEIIFSCLNSILYLSILHLHFCRLQNASLQIAKLPWSMEELEEEL